MAKLNAGDFDQPIVFALTILFIVMGGLALFSWLFAKTGLTGPLGLAKGGACLCGSSGDMMSDH